MSRNSHSLIEAEALTKSYHAGNIATLALNGVTLRINRGEFTALAGPSGSGKSTFLNLVSGLDTPTSGRVRWGGRDLGTMNKGDLADFRRDHIGFVFQAYNLIPVLTVEENVEYVMTLQGIPGRTRSERVAEVLQELGLSGFQRRFPAELSGGQQQRVAVARALVTKPDIIFADEPTANLDSKTGAALVRTLEELNTRRGVTILFSSHDPMVLERSRRLILLHDGEVQQDVVKEARS